jgi:hypothetical protein
VIGFSGSRNKFTNTKVLEAETWVALRNVGVANQRLEEAKLLSTLFLMLIIHPAAMSDFYIPEYLITE